MLRNLAIALSFSAMAALPAHAVTVEPAATSSLTEGCTVQNGICNLNLSDTRVRIGTGAGNDFLADPSSSFDFLVFKGRETDSYGDQFEASATLAFKVAGSTLFHYATSIGTGSFRTDDGKFTSFKLNWAPIANILVAGVGTFSVAFQNIDLAGNSLNDSNDTNDSNDSNDANDEFERVYVRANVTQISAVPLPAGMWLLGSALVVLGAARLRRRPTA